MSDRGQQIEAFYWLLMRVGMMAFGYLMMIGGGLMALSFALEKWRTGMVAFGGQEHTDPGMALRLVLIPAAVAVIGLLLVRQTRRWHRRVSGE